MPGGGSLAGSNIVAVSPSTTGGGAALFAGAAPAAGVLPAGSVAGLDADVSVAAFVHDASARQSSNFAHARRP